MAISQKKKKADPLEAKAELTYQYKAPPAVQQHRIKELYNLMLQGYTRSELLQFGSEKWNISTRQVETYCAVAKAHLLEINKVSREETASMIVRNLWSMFREHGRDNPDLARKILGDIAKLRGLDQATINHVLHDKRDMSNMSDGELDQLLEG